LNRSKAFTLIELLVVIAIMQFWRRFYSQCLATAREKARMAACASNEKQFGIALMQYVQDYDESFPQGTVNLYGTPGKGWAGQLYPYFKSPGMMVCPSDPTGNISHGWSYGYNNVLAGYTQTTPTYPWYDGYTSVTDNVHSPAQMSMLTAPTKTVAIFEVTESVKAGDLMTHQLTPFDETAGRQRVAAWTRQRHVYQLSVLCHRRVTQRPGSRCGSNGVCLSLVGRHNNGANYIMADGHVKWLLPTQVTGGDGNPNSTTFCSSSSSGSWYEYSGTQCSDPTLVATYGTL